MHALAYGKKYGARVVQASTSEVYGDPEVCPQTEEYRGSVSTIGPRACYDEGKRAAETLCMDYYREHNLDVGLVRIFNTYGPHMDPHDGRVVTNLITAALDGRPFTIYGDGQQTRSFCYVDDLVEGIIKMGNKNGFTGPVNLGNPNELPISDFADTVERIFGKPILRETRPMPTDDPKRRCPDVTLAKKELNWEPKVSLEEGLTKTIAYFKALPQSQKHVLVFAPTYFPHAGSAERALRELTQTMPETTFHIITTKFTPKNLSYEEMENERIYRIGIGSYFDKFLLPIVGVWKAYELHEKYQFTFAWSVMASYGGLALALFKRMTKNVATLITLDEKEGGIGKSFAGVIATLLVRDADSSFISYSEDDKKKEIFSGVPIREVCGGQGFAQQVRGAYISILNKKKDRLDAPK